MNAGDETEIDLKDLRRAINRVLDHMESQGKQKMVLSMDYYWEVDEEARYLIDKPEGNHLVVGQLFDDWETVVKLSQGEKDILSWHLVPISAVLRWIGESEVA